MGDYYKIKKLLLICMIVLTIIRIFKGSNVFASEAVEVTPTWNDGSYTYQADDQILTLRQNQIDVQNGFINFCYKAYFNGTSTQKTNILNSLRDIYRFLASSDGASLYYGGLNRRFIHFENVLTTVDGVTTYNYSYTTVTGRYMTNIVYADATLNTGYKILSVPFYQFSLSLNSGCIHKLLKSDTAELVDATSGTYMLPVAEVGVYSELWIQLFKDLNLIQSTSEYQNVLNNIEGTQELIYQQELSQSYYAGENNEILSNTYNYLESTQHVDETSMPFQTITATDPYSFDDFLDNLENILTNENYVPKQFTLTLPNNRSFNFSINPNMTEQLLTRIGGENVYGLITIMWYMGIYGIIIFDFKRMLNQILSGDWMHITTDSSPIDNVVSASFNATGATSTSTSHSGGDR